MVAVIENANLQRPQKKITVEYLAWFIKNILGNRYNYDCLENMCREVKCQRYAEVGFEVCR